MGSGEWEVGSGEGYYIASHSPLPTSHFLFYTIHKNFTRTDLVITIKIVIWLRNQSYYDYYQAY